MSWIQWLRALASTPSVSKMPVHGSTRFEYSAVDVRYWSTVTTNGIFSSAFFTMPVLGHCVMGLPVIDHSTFTFTGSSFRTASPNVKRGMAATSSVAFGTSSGLPVATSFMPPASLTPSPTCPTWPQNAARYAPTAVAYVPFSVRMKPPMFCTIIACSAPAYSFAMRSMSAAGTPHSSSAAARSHADASATISSNSVW